MGGGVNRGIYDFTAKKGLNHWVFYVNGENDTVIQGNDSIVLRGLNSNIFSLILSPRYYSGGNYSNSCNLTVYNLRNGDGSDLVISSGNAMVIGSGDGVKNFYLSLNQSLTPEPLNQPTSSIVICKLLGMIIFSIVTLPKLSYLFHFNIYLN